MAETSLPDGWRIEMEVVPMGATFDVQYAAFRWGSTVKRVGLLRRKKTVTGWLRVGYHARHCEDVEKWILDTVRAMESKRG